MNIRIVSRKNPVFKVRFGGVRPHTDPGKAAQAGSKTLHFEACMPLNQDGLEGAKSFRAVTTKDPSGATVITDYQDVRLKGYLSTFAATTPSDREGDYVEPGAFTETIPIFMRNPVLLVNHSNSVQAIAGHFEVVREDGKGLYVEALLSNSPSEICRDTRFKVAEGTLKTMSMGGVFYYRDDGRGIFKVSLWEGSLTPIPANPDATFTTRSLSDLERKKLGLALAA